MTQEILKIKAERQTDTKRKLKWLVDTPAVSISVYIHKHAEIPKILEIELLKQGEEA